MSSRARGRAAAAVVVAWVAVAAPGCGTGPLMTATQAGSGGELSGAGAGGAGAGGAAMAGGAAGGEPAGPVDFCKGCALQSGCTSFANGELLEASGIEPSVVQPGAYYVHNDSGDKPRYFATNCAGDDLGTYELFGAGAVDWEDMSSGPCGAKRCLYFGDIGDNDEVRSSVAIYRTEEPEVLAAGKHVVPSEKLTFTYPDGAHNAETLLVHPKTGAMVVVTKVTKGKSGVYAFPSPFVADATVEVVKVGEVEPPSGSPRITSGAVHPEAEAILLRTYTSLFLYAMKPGEGLADALAAPPCEMPVMLELQGESVTFTSNGAGYVTVSEQSGQSLHFAACK